MQTFFLKKHSTLPVLRLQLINDGRHDFKKFHEAIENASITFTMTNTETNVIKIANAEAYIAEKEGEGCETQYLICYKWKPRDTKEKGVYEGVFNIHFNEDLTSEYTTYPNGDLIMPIREKLIIVIE